MKGYPIEKGSPVLEMIGLEITGNVVPLEWFNHIQYPDGKPQTNAILILADIVYWYRPIEVRDEKTGKPQGYLKKFEADWLQKNHNAYMDLYGLTSDQVKDAFSLLEKMGVITTQRRHPVIRGVKFGNVLYIRLNVDRLTQITFSDEDTPVRFKPHSPLSGLNRTGSPNQPPLPLKSHSPVPLKSHTNTESTLTETEGKDGNPPPENREAGTGRDWKTVWMEIRVQLKLQTAPSVWINYLRDAWLVGPASGVLQIGVAQDQTRDWLQSRMKTTVDRLLNGAVPPDSGICEVEFITAPPPEGWPKQV